MRKIRYLINFPPRFFESSVLENYFEVFVARSRNLIKEHAEKEKTTL